MNDFKQAPLSVSWLTSLTLQHSLQPIPLISGEKQQPAHQGEKRTKETKEYFYKEVTSQ